jgi:MoaA/NifB/PqqE/SkfB family radical SAM enzyme
MCQIWTHNNEQHPENEINADEIRQIIQKNGLIWVSLTGGEPFLNRDIEKILANCLKYTRLTSIVSNGSLPDLISRSVSRSLTETTDGLLVFSLSLEGNERVHDSVVGVEGSFKQVIETIEKLKRINNKRFYLGVEFVVSPLTDGSQKDAERIAREYKIGITYTREQSAPYYRNVDGSPPAERLFSDYRLSIKPFDMFHNLFLWGLNHNKGKLCEAGKYSIFIDPYANAYPCLPYAPEHPIKNLRDTGYAIGDIRKEANELFQQCKSPCFTPCEVYASMLFRPWRLL